MAAPLLATIFLEFNLPNATTWFYLSFLLSMALFFKFSRLLSMRNLDVVTLFLLVPGLLILQESHLSDSQPGRNQWYGYLWLLCGSAYFLFRCLIDLTLVRRPALAPNLSLGGLAWLGGTLAVCLVPVALRTTTAPPSSHTGPAENAPVGKGPAAVTEAQRWVEKQVHEQTFWGDQHTSFWVSRSLALLCHVAVVTGLIFVGYRHFQDLHAGMAAATFYLLLPYTAIHIGQVHHVWPIALLVWAVASYRRPTLAGLLIGLAAGSVYFPALVFPVWFSFYRGRGAGRFTLSFVLAATLSLSIVGTILWVQGDLEGSLNSALALSDWQPWKPPSTEGFWRWIDGTSIHWAYRIPVFVGYLAFLVTTAFWPSPKNLAHVLALSANVLIGIQFWYADQGGVYVLWYLPLLLLLVFRPNLVDAVPPLIPPDQDWLTRAGRMLSRQALRILKHPEPVSHMH